MVKEAEVRIRHYRERLIPDVDYIKRMAARETMSELSVLAQTIAARIDKATKTILDKHGVGAMFQFGYFCFSRKVGKLDRTHSGKTLKHEIAYAVADYTARGFEPSVLGEIVEAITPIVLYEGELKKALVESHLDSGSSESAWKKGDEAASTLAQKIQAEEEATQTEEDLLKTEIIKQP